MALIKTFGSLLSTGKNYLNIIESPGGSLAEFALINGLRLFKVLEFLWTKQF